jgi:hypothetical protein
MRCGYTCAWMIMGNMLDLLLVLLIASSLHSSPVATPFDVLEDQY